MNEVRLAGRLSAEPVVKELPSGDEIVQLRVVVPRVGVTKKRAGVTKGDPPAKARATVDVIDVTCWTARTKNRAITLAVDDLVEVEGALHRRFFRTPGGTQSRYDVEASRVKRTSVKEASAATRG